jgi:hypothetical protein
MGASVFALSAQSHLTPSQMRSHPYLSAHSDLVALLVLEHQARTRTFERIVNGNSDSVNERRQGLFRRHSASDGGAPVRTHVVLMVITGVAQEPVADQFVKDLPHHTGIRAPQPATLSHGQLQPGHREILAADALPEFGVGH